MQGGQMPTAQSVPATPALHKQSAALGMMMAILVGITVSLVIWWMSSWLWKRYQLRLSPIIVISFATVLAFMLSLLFGAIRKHTMQQQLKDAPGRYVIMV